MHILNLSEATGMTGGANQVLLTSAELARRGHRTTLACPAEGEVARRAAALGLPVEPVEIRRDFDLGAAWRLVEVVRRLRPQVLHAHHPKAHAMALLALLLMGPSAPPLVVTRRVVFPIGRNPFSRFKYRSRRITRFIAVCEAIGEELRRAGVDARRVEVVPSAVDFDRYAAALRARAELNGHGPRVVGMVGHYASFKGHEVFLKAAAEVARAHPESRFWVVGRDTERLRPLVESLGLASRVELFGERADVPELLARMHLYAMPSLMEGIGTALIEAQASGVPVVASRVGGLPEVVEDGVTGLLVPPSDPAALAAAIALSLADPEAARARAQRGLARVTERYSLPSVVDRLEALYRTVAA